MNTSTVIEFSQQALMLTLWLGAPMVIATALVGLTIGVFQALTQIQDQTLAHAVKTIVVFGLLLLLGAWLGATLLNFGERILGAIAGIR
jgi:type III secretion HrpO family protein